VGVQGPAESKSDSLVRFKAFPHLGPSGWSPIDSTGRKTALASKLAEPFQAVQQSANAGWVPSAALCGWYLSLVQLARNGLRRDAALCPECANFRSQGLRSHVRGLLVCQYVVAGCDQAQTRQHPLYGGAMPATAAGGRYSSSVQLIRQRTARNEASRHKLSNGRGQSTGPGVCRPLDR
jgi:hypothetical protein